MMVVFAFMAKTSQIFAGTHPAQIALKKKSCLKRK
jgi:hypothetical protein